MNILYISYDGITDPLGQSQILPYIRRLSNKGANFTVLTFEKRKDLNAPGGITEILDDNICWKRLRYHKNPPVISTYYDILRGLFAGIFIVIKGKISIIHARSYVAAIIALILNQLFGPKFIFDMRGFWPDERIDGGIWKKRGFLYYLSKYFEKIFLLTADKIISLTKAGKKELENLTYLKNHSANIVVIPTCVDLNRFQIKKQNCNDKGVSRKFTFIYAGSVSTWYMPGEMINFFKIAKTEMPNTHLLILTMEKRFLENILNENVLNESLSIISASYSSIPNYISSADVGLAFYKPGYSRKACCPTKVGEYLACGIPVIINAGIGDCDETVLKEKVGVVINEFSSKEYEMAIRELKGLISEGDALKARCRAAAEKYFSLEMGVERYWNTYRRLIEE